MSQETDLEPGPPRKTPGWIKRFRRAALAAVAPLVIRLLVNSWRLKVIDRSGLDDAGPRVMVAWHGHLAALAPYGFQIRPRLLILVSPSRDGERGAQIGAKFGFRTARGSSSRGGVAALRTLLRELRSHTWVGMLGDGPRGPAHELKPGPALLSAMGRVPVVPVTAACHHCWRLKTWDKTMIPWPFSRITVTLGEPIPPAESTDRDTLERTRILIQHRLNDQMCYPGHN